MLNVNGFSCVSTSKFTTRESIEEEKLVPTINELIWFEPLTTPSPFVLMYLVSKSVVNCSEPLIVPVGNTSTTPLEKCEEPVSSVSVLVAEISPPPLKPSPAVILTDV